MSKGTSPVQCLHISVPYKYSLKIREITVNSKVLFCHLLIIHNILQQISAVRNVRNYATVCSLLRTELKQELKYNINTVGLNH